MTVLAYVLVVILAPIAEIFLWKIGFFSIIFVLTFHWISKKTFSIQRLLFISFMSLVLDVAMHFALGYTLLAICAGIIFYVLFSKIVETKEDIVKYFVLFLTFVIVHFILGSISLGKVYFDFMNVRMGFIEVVVFFILDKYIYMYVNSSTRGITIKRR